jgi:HEAT repeat protein
MSFSLATLSVFFRLIIGVYTIGVVNFFWFNFLDAPGKTIDDYIEIIQSPKTPLYEKETAIERLCQFPADSKKIIDCLVETIELSDEIIRNRVTGKLKSVGPVAIKPLAEKLLDPRLHVRNAAMNVLISMEFDWKDSEYTESVIKRLLSRLASPKPEIREHAQTALMSIDPDWRQRKEVNNLVDEFVDRLHSHDPEIRCLAALALGTLGRVAKSSLPVLKQMINDENISVKTEAEKALEKIE